MGTKVHGESHDTSIGGTDICTEQTELQRNRDTVEVTTNCDTAKSYLVGKEDHTLSLGGALEFGASATEDTMWAAFDAGTAQAWIIETDGDSAEGAGNPYYNGSGIVNSLSITFPVSGAITYSASVQGTSAVSRDITP